MLKLIQDHAQLIYTHAELSALHNLVLGDETAQQILVGDESENHVDVVIYRS